MELIKNNIPSKNSLDQFTCYWVVRKKFVTEIALAAIETERLWVVSIAIDLIVLGIVLASQQLFASLGYFGLPIDGTNFSFTGFLLESLMNALDSLAW